MAAIGVLRGLGWGAVRAAVEPHALWGGSRGRGAGAAGGGAARASYTRATRAAAAAMSDSEHSEGEVEGSGGGDGGGRRSVEEKAARKAAKKAQKAEKRAKRCAPSLCALRLGFFRRRPLLSGRKPRRFHLSITYTSDKARHASERVTGLGMGTWQGGHCRARCGAKAVRLVRQRGGPLSTLPGAVRGPSPLVSPAE